MIDVSEREDAQAFLYRVITTNKTVEKLVEESTLREPPGGFGGGSSGSGGALEFFSTDAQRAARRMGRIYELLYCFENSVRELVETALKESLGPDDWWQTGVPETIRKKAETRRRDDERARWHGPRGQTLLNFVDFPELGGIITDRWGDFEDLLGDKDWVERYFGEMNRSRRAIGHTGEMNEHAVERMELSVREWLLVVG